MIHHDGRDYQTAKSEAAKQMKLKLESMFSLGQGSVTSALESLMSTRIQDAVVRPTAIQFDAHPGRVGVKVGSNGDEKRFTAHPHALQQVYSKLGMPKRYADNIIGSDWGANLLAHNLNTLMTHRASHERFLMRSTDDTLKAFLSDKFRRMDSAPLIEAFIGGIKETGAVPLQGYALDTKFYMRFILPHMFEPIPNEILAFGLEFRNSDFGDGRLAISEFVYRMWCTNLAVGVDHIRKTHLGPRLADDIHYSDETYQLDTKTLASAVSDTVRGALTPHIIDARLQTIKNAAGEVDGKDIVKVLKRLQDKHLNKAEADSVSDLYKSPDVQLLPPGNSMWRLSNAISLLANKTDDKGRSLELQTIAGEVIGLNKE